MKLGIDHASRTTKYGLTALVGSLALLLPRTAGAQGVSEYGLFKVQAFQQTTTTPPPSPSSFYCSLRLDTLSAGAITTGTVTWTGTGTDSPATLTFLSTGSANGVPIWEYWWPSSTYTLKTDLDAHCPATTYQFATAGGTSGTASASMTATSDAYTASIAALDAPSFTAVQAYDPSANLTLSTVSHLPAAGTEFTGTWLDLDDPASNTTVASAYGSDGGVLSLQLEGGALLPAHAYEVNVYFSDRVLVDNAGFGATSESAFDLSTRVDFTTLGGEGGAPDGSVEGGGQPDATAPDAGVVDSGVGADSSAAADTSVADSTTEEDSGFTVGVDSGGPTPSGGGGSKPACSCRAAGLASSESGGAMLVALGLAAVSRRRRR